MLLKTLKDPHKASCKRKQKLNKNKTDNVFSPLVKKKDMNTLASQKSSVNLKNMFSNDL